MNYTSLILFILSLTGFMITLVEVPDLLANSSKHDIYSRIGRFYNLWVYSAIIGVSIAYAQKKQNRSLVIGFIILLILDSFLIMNRTFITFGIMCIITMYLHSKGPIKLIKIWKVGVGTFVLCLLVLTFHHLKDDFKKGDFKTIFSRMTTIEFYSYSVINSEPWGIQGILNEVVKERFKVDASHFQSLVYIGIPFATAFGFETSTYNDEFQKELFPYATGGRASNPWAEMWSSGGWYLLSFFVCFYNFFLGIGSILIKSQYSVYKGLFVLIFFIFSFYVHRNGLSSLLMFERRIFFLIFGCLLLSNMVFVCLKQTQKPIVYHRRKTLKKKILFFSVLKNLNLNRNL